MKFDSDRRRTDSADTGIACSNVTYIIQGRGFMGKCDWGEL